MNIQQFEKSLQRPKPVYILRTDQEYFKRRVRELAESQVDEGARTFDWNVFDLENDSAAELISTARTLPWASAHRWMYVQNAHSAAPELKPYLEAPSSRTVLVLETSKKVRGWPDLPEISMGATAPLQWVGGRVEEEGFRIEPRAARMLVELVGDDLQRLSMELEKLFLYRLDSQRITMDSVLEMAFQTREFDTFALINAIASKQGRKALEILNRLFDSGATAPMMLAMLYWCFRRVLVLHEMVEGGKRFDKAIEKLRIFSYRSRERDVRSYDKKDLLAIVNRLRETDRLLKSSSADPRITLERFVVDTCSTSTL